MPFQPLALFADWSGGANTEDFSDRIAKNQSPYPLNVEFFATYFRKARGYVAFGTEPDTGVLGFSLFNHRILSNEEVLIKTIGTKLKFLDEINDTFYPISSTTFTTDLRWWFASFNGYLYGGNGTDNFFRWRGSAWGELSGAVLSGAATIDLVAGEGARFPASGDGFIEGDTFSWSGKSTDQLTGVTGLGSNHPSGARVVMAADTSTYSGNPKGSIGAFFRNRLFVRLDASPNFIYFSKLADNTNPEDDLANFTIAGSGTGDSGFIPLPAAMVGLRVFITGGNDPVLVAFCADGIAYSVTVIDSGSTTVGTATPFKVLGEDLVAKSMTTITENDLMAVTGKGTLRALNYGENSTTLKTTRLSDIIQPTTDAIDFSDGAMIYFNRDIFIQGKVNDSDANNFTIVKHTNPNAFAFRDYLAMNDFVEWKNRLIAISSINEKTYEIGTVYNADGGNIRASYPTHMEDFGAPLLFKNLKKIRVSGYFTTNCQLYFKVYFDDSTSPFTFLIAGDNTNVVSTADNVAIGTVVFGGAVVGGNLSGAGTLNSFIADLNIPDMDYFRKMSVVIENNQADVDFAIDKMLAWAERASADLDFEDEQLAIDTAT